MRLSSTLSLGSLGLASSVAAAAPARNAVLHIPRGLNWPDSFTLSPSEARLVLAQRLGLSQYHSLQNASESSMNAINTWGFSEDPFDRVVRSDNPKLLLVVEGVEDPESFLPSQHVDVPTITIENAPSTEATTQFLKDLAAQQQRTYSRQTPGYDTNCTLQDLESCLNSWVHAAKYARAQPPLHHSLSLTKLAKKEAAGPSDVGYVIARQYLEQALISHLRPGPRDVDLAVLLLPLAQPPRKSLFSWRTPEQPTWGTYTPAGQSQPTTRLSRRQELPTDPFITLEENNDNIDKQDDDDDKDTTPPPGILKVCYSSESTCQSATNTCSGHGACKKLYTMPDGGGDEGKECWACACKPTTKETDAGVKTTVWAGPACQKKDVSTPFWLLAGASIGLVSAVAFGIGMLVEMGGQELPSVLSAGVTGTGARAK